MVLNRDPAVLRMLAFDDVQVGDDLDAADHRRGHRGLDEENVLKLTVDPEPHSQAAFLGIEVDVGRLAVAGPFEDLADELGEGGGLSLFLEFLANVAMMLGAVRGKRPCGGCGDDGGLRGITIVRGQRAQSLERELVEQVGRNQIELEDRLAQVSIVLVAVDLRGSGLLDGEQAAIDRATRPAIGRRGRGSGRARSVERGISRVGGRSRGEVRRGGRRIHGGDLLGVRSTPGLPAGALALYPSCNTNE